MTLVNSNPATIMTDPEFADATYVEPITPEFIDKILTKEAADGHPVDAVLATLGGQTALNAAMQLDAQGLLDKHGVELIGADIPAINRGEDRQTFKDIVASVGGESARSAVCHTMEEVHATVAELGLPVVVRPSFTMGGLGSGLAYTTEDLERIAGGGLSASPTANVLIEESILGWKEYELELMRDNKDNVVVICSIENVDALGVHTGDSVTVAPSMTLTDREFQNMRDLGIAIIRAVGVDTGGCNIQFAINPVDGRLVVIEMNPRVSRSSALASKATGFPIAKIAARLAIGYSLDEITNDITGETPACFEPTLDYVVVKAPRFAFEKFPGADDTLTTTMKSVGEAMSLGRNYREALGKVMRSLETKASGFWTLPDETIAPGRSTDVDAVLADLVRPTEGRMYDVELALRLGATVQQVHEASGIDPWFLEEVAELVDLRREIVDAAVLGADLLRRAKHNGLSDAQIAALRPEFAGAEGVRRGVRGQDPVPLLDLRARPRRRVRGRPADRAREGDHPRFRAQPHRPGHRVRLLLRARRPDAVRGRVRDGHGQLQPGDGLDRLRHGRPAVLRAPDVRGRHGGLPRRVRVRHGRRCAGAARWPDPAGAGRAARGRRRAHRGHQPVRDRPGRGPPRVR